MKKYEYKVITMGAPVAITVKQYSAVESKMEEELNKLGSEGWEFIEWKNSMMIFKREISSR